ncbi:MAG: type II toxin-antitoxin system VapC family toxin [Planctomycetes bacterium]|nr:type II toxin-antitoxin system VapC family toxin [Planctomycetota bacterium]
MTYADLLPGASVFHDANPLVYHFSPHSGFAAACTHLVDRIERGELAGFTSPHILTEVAHRLMLFEAAAAHGWPHTKVRQRLQRNSGAFQGLTQFRAAVESVLNSQVRVLTIAPSLILTAADISRSVGLLSNDALLVAVMQTQGLTHVASADTDFDRVPGLTRYAPA